MGRTVGIIGLGLIGGSMAIDLRRRGFATRVIGVEHEPINASAAGKIGLVDEIGTLEDAINYAASAIGASDVCVLEYPKPLTTMESLMASLGQTAEHDYVKAFQKMTEPQVVARMPYQVVVY